MNVLSACLPIGLQFLKIKFLISIKLSKESFAPGYRTFVDSYNGTLSLLYLLLGSANSDYHYLPKTKITLSQPNFEKAATETNHLITDVLTPEMAGTLLASDDKHGRARRQRFV